MTNAEVSAPEKKRMIPILVNRESAINIPTAREKDGSIRPDSIIFLASGYNLVDEEQWKVARKNPMVQTLLQTKIPQATSPEMSPEKVGSMILVEGKPCDVDNPLAALSEDEALSFVSETFQVKMLNRLIEQESRAQVLRALRAQVDRIEKPKAEARAKAR